jgi:RecB family exonuclease
VITPRRTRLLRAPDLRAFQRAIFDSLPADPSRARQCAVLVPTRGAAEELRRHRGNPGQDVLYLGRDEFYEELRQRLPGRPSALSAFEREVLLRRAARAAHVAGVEPPFNLRPGLVREILALYDALRRHHRTVADFERLVIGTLDPVAGIDRGAARLLAQTKFLAATFHEFERSMATGASPERAQRVEEADEHRVRTLALEAPGPLFTKIVVTVADQAADAHGLWATDFDLLARLPGLEDIDVIATEALLASGYYERLHERLLPGIEDVRLPAPAEPLPVLVVPDADPRTPAYGAARPFVARDREEELAAVARLAAIARERGGDIGRIGAVFQRPLPYLYLARQVFADARVPYQALDSLPLAAEPFAAAVDLIFAAIAAGFTRGALLELLRSPHFRFADGARRTEDGGRRAEDGGTKEEASALSAADVHALDRRLVKEKYLGGVDRLRELAPAPVIAAVEELQAAADAPTAPAQIDGILAFIAARERLPLATDAWHERHMRARGAVLSALAMLRQAHAQQDPEPLSVGELSGAVRRWIDAQTFSPRTGDAGVRLLDAHTAPFADVDELRLVGLVESDWPERSTRSIFYPQSLLAQLGWPADQERLAASRTRFQDLLRLPRARVSLSTFTLEDDTIVSPSPLLEDVDAVGLPIERFVVRPGESLPPLVHEALMRNAADPAIAGSLALEWLALRRARSFDAPRFRGITGPRAPAVYAASKLERYLECPFKYFAAHVLRLPEERDEEAWMTPQERGHFVHEVFEEFFTEWQAAGRGAITTANVAAALALFEEVGERHLARLPEGDRALERTLLLGSAAAAGFGERAFAFEIDEEVPVVERLLEYELEGRFMFAGEHGPRELTLRSKSDRIDLLADGTLRVVDYKIGRAPERKRALQLPIYGACASQALAGRHGRAWTVGRAGYIAFKEKTPFVELQKPASAIADGEARLVATVEAIERGEFPVRPDEPFLCNWCPYPGVCRKDYVGDEFEK